MLALGHGADEAGPEDGDIFAAAVAQARKEDAIAPLGAQALAEGLRVAPGAGIEDRRQRIARLAEVDMAAIDPAAVAAEIAARLATPRVHGLTAQ